MVGSFYTSTRFGNNNASIYVSQLSTLFLFQFLFISRHVLSLSCEVLEHSPTKLLLLIDKHH
ncbi:hypothetical protein NC652_036155 [Populus alba x Populus x berolinensis]|nr:hypothetical protein NC652_036155 [Populus alba x Populus x berolinensis]